MGKLIANCIVALVWICGIDWRRRARMMGTIQGILHTKLTTAIETQSGRLRFSTHSLTAADRPRSGPKSEPDTMAWIEKLPQNAVLWDIGANIDLFSLYAVLRPSVKVLAFEPGAATYAALNENVKLNGMDERILAYPVALAGKTRLDYFNMSSTEAGTALHGFGTERDVLGRAIPTKYRQGAIGFAIDDFVRLFSPPAPTHVKIDVDGIEPEVLRGGRETLSAPGVQSMMVEMVGDLESAHNQEIYHLMNELGFRARPKQSSRNNNVVFDR